MDSLVREALHSARKKWNDGLPQSISGAGPEKSSSGLPIELLYAPVDCEPQSNYLERLGFPGHYPFTRGVRASGYRGKLWTMRQVAGFHTAEDTNRRLKFLIEQGQTGINVVFDQPTQFTLDSDHPLARGEVGKVGVPLDTLADFEDLFDGISLERISVSLISNSGWVILPFYVALADKLGIARASLTGTLQDDPLLVFHSCGTYSVPLDGALHLLADVVEFCNTEIPRWNAINIAGYNTREAGASAVQEAAFALASGIEYTNRLIARGLNVDQFAPRISFFLSAHNDLFEEIAKFRAMRRMWASMMRERFGAKNPDSWLLRFHAQTAGSTLTAQQPLNNIVRVSLQALAAILGGTQSLHTNSFDEALSLPSKEAATLSLRTQQIIAHESGVTRTIDPLGGSYFVEALTDQLEAATKQVMGQIEEMGGMAEACRSGWVQREKFKHAEAYHREIEAGQRVVVGVNRFQQATDTTDIRLFEADPAREQEQLRRLQDVRQRRDEKAVASALAELRAACERRANVLEPAIRAAAAYATVGEIGGIYKVVFGEQRQPQVDAVLI